MLALGAKKIIIGTAASGEFLSQLPKDKVLLAIDAKNGKISQKGWTEEIEQTPADFVKRFDGLCSGYLYTIVENEGMMQGTKIDEIKKIRELTKHELVAAGGISTVEEIVELQKMNVSSQLGMSIYTGAMLFAQIWILKKRADLFRR